MEVLVQIIAFAFTCTVIALPFLVAFKCVRFVQVRLGFRQTQAARRVKRERWSLPSKTLCFSCREYGAVIGKPSLDGSVDSSGFANWR